jgi:hypothetical protein
MQASDSNIPETHLVGQDLDWSAPWIDVRLCVELPFWLMLDDTRVDVEIDGHRFPVSTHDNYFELYGGELTDSRATVCYQGPPKRLEDMPALQQLQRDNPRVPFMWRKCKTVLAIHSRCNADAWNAAVGDTPVSQNTRDLYFQALCNAHIPIVNRVIQAYRLATYDYFPFEVAPWDVPRWLIARGNQSVGAHLVPYRTWDAKPRLVDRPGTEPMPYQLLDGSHLAAALGVPGTPGELELMDALNLLERGDYSGAVRRITTAVEVVVGERVGTAVAKSEGEEQAKRFLKDTRNRFDLRVAKCEELTGRTLPETMRASLKETRDLRHVIVHRGFRIAYGDRHRAQKAVDTGRWTFNWFENDATRSTLREQRVAFRSLGRNLLDGVFRTRITGEGVVVLPPERPGDD